MCVTRRRILRFALYLLHEGNRKPYADKLKQAEGIEKSLTEYYRAATGGRMHLIPARPPAVD